MNRYLDMAPFRLCLPQNKRERLSPPCLDYGVGGGLIQLTSQVREKAESEGRHDCGKKELDCEPDPYN